MIRGPGFPRGRRVAGQVQLTDVFPTVLDALGIEDSELLAPVEGVSLLDVDATVASSPTSIPGSRDAFAEMLAPHPAVRALNRRAGVSEDIPRPEYDRSLRCLRTPTHKVIWASDGRHALYDLASDPGENENLAASELE